LGTVLNDITEVVWYRCASKHTGMISAKHQRQGLFRAFTSVRGKHGQWTMLASKENA